MMISRVQTLKMFFSHTKHNDTHVTETVPNAPESNKDYGVGNMFFERVDRSDNEVEKAELMNISESEVSVSQELLFQMTKYKILRNLK